MLVEIDWEKGGLNHVTYKYIIIFGAKSGNLLIALVLTSLFNVQYVTVFLVFTSSLFASNKLTGDRVRTFNLF